MIVGMGIDLNRCLHLAAQRPLSVTLTWWFTVAASVGVSLLGYWDAYKPQEHSQFELLCTSALLSTVTL